MELPKLVKLQDMSIHIYEGTRVCMKLRYRGMQDYQDFYGTDINKLPSDIMDTLYVEHITARIEYMSDGVYPILIITASDDINMITIDKGMILNQFHHTDDPDKYNNEEGDVEHGD